MDPIERQAAIDAILHNQEVYSNNFGDDPIDKYTIAIIDNDAQTIAKLPSAQPYTEAEIQKMQELEQAELQKAYECGRASAQPDIIRCKDCKYYTHMWYCEAWNNSPGFPAVSDDMFCSLAERREDG